MQLPQYLSSHFRAVFFGGNWTVSNLKDTLAGVTVEQATKQVHGFNTIAMLTYHIGYFVSALHSVLKGEALTANDKFSFNCPPLTTQQDWDNLVTNTLNEAEEVATLIEQMHEAIVWETFVNEKYGNYYRNIAGITEHTHYHLGQIALIKKLVQA